MHEVAIHVSSHAVHPGDRGLVVVGASTQLGDIASHTAAGARPANYNATVDVSKCQSYR